MVKYSIGSNKERKLSMGLTALQQGDRIQQ
ncbi:hypothetical protein SAMN05421593_2368 [Chryseobacterium culicis]|jgi:hypothetical protein|uniref:Uncharacterized protein n=1 Tax=Chryseobacterium culicis TaxID=680127 RepID=A0A1H6HH30_CHRCI|nr:hypothetical protein SAMN05421593_2368 [Chryseobacterium culicis]